MGCQGGRQVESGGVRPQQGASLVPIIGAGGRSFRGESTLRTGLMTRPPADHPVEASVVTGQMQHGSRR